MEYVTSVWYRVTAYRAHRRTSNAISFYSYPRKRNGAVNGSIILMLLVIDQSESSEISALISTNLDVRHVQTLDAFIFIFKQFIFISPYSRSTTNSNLRLPFCVMISERGNFNNYEIGISRREPD